MTATLDGVANKRKDKPEPTAEQKLAEELVARAREQGVSKQHRHRLAPLARHRTRRQGRAAPVAEPGIRRILPPTPSTDPHTARLSPASERGHQKDPTCHRRHPPEPAQGDWLRQTRTGQSERQQPEIGPLHDERLIGRVTS
jgi:hypothetical protein